MSASQETARTGKGEFEAESEQPQQDSIEGLSSSTAENPRLLKLAHDFTALDIDFGSPSLDRKIPQKSPPMQIETGRPVSQRLLIIKKSFAVGKRRVSISSMPATWHDVSSVFLQPTQRLARSATVRAARRAPPPFPLEEPSTTTPISRRGGNSKVRTTRQN